MSKKHRKICEMPDNFVEIYPLNRYIAKKERQESYFPPGFSCRKEEEW